MIVLLLNFIGLCFSIFIIVIVILTWTNTNKLVHNETFIAGESDPYGCFSYKNLKDCQPPGAAPECQWKQSPIVGGPGVCVPVSQ